MRKTPWIIAERYRREHPVLNSAPYGSDYGFFMVKGPTRVLAVMATAASVDAPWDHVSVSLPDRCPTWEEMCFIKDMFFDESECVVQYHPPKSDYVDCAKHCLHLWRPADCEMPRPDKSLVGGW